LLWGSVGIPTLFKVLIYAISVAFSANLHVLHFSVSTEADKDVQPMEVPCVSNPGMTGV